MGMKKTMQIGKCHHQEKMRFDKLLKFCGYIGSSKMTERECKNSVRDRENVQNVSDEKEAAILHYGLFEGAILFRFKFSFNSKLSSYLSSPLPLSLK